MTSYKWICLTFPILLCTMCILREVGGQGCPKGWYLDPNGIQCFQAIYKGKGLKWSAAREQCKSLRPKDAQVDLATILNAETNRLINKVVATGNNSYFIGLNDREQEDTWVWANTNVPSSDYTNWKSPAPYDSTEIQNEVAIEPSGQWNDSGGDRKPFPFVCEIFDKDECSSNNGGCSQICINKIGSHVCDCGRGFVFTDSGKCEDLDECKANNGNCAHVCNNYYGTHGCSCYSGFQMIGSQCVDIDECSVDNGGCSQNCTNTPGSFNCSCMDDFQHYETHCFDENECKMSRGGCDHVCTDTLGSFKCSCLDDFTEDGSKCVAQFSAFYYIVAFLMLIIGLLSGLLAYRIRTQEPKDVEFSFKGSKDYDSEANGFIENNEKESEEEEGRDEQRKASNETDETAEEAE